MSFIVKSSLLSNMDTLIRYQNNLLIRKIAEEKKWPLAELKKFLPKKQKIKLDQETEILPEESEKPKKSSKVKRSEPNFKIIKKKVIKKKVVVKKPVSSAESLVSKMKGTAAKNKKIIKKSVPKKKIIPKSNKTIDTSSTLHTVEESNFQTLEVQSILYEENEYYLNPKTDKIYVLGDEDTLVFTGMLEGNKINFDAESAED